METAERQHAKKMEQILASIDKKLERIASSLEKMEPTIYKLPYFDIPLDVQDATKEKSRSNTGPAYARECLPDMFKP